MRGVVLLLSVLLGGCCASNLRVASDSDRSHSAFEQVRVLPFRVEKIEAMEGSRRADAAQIAFEITERVAAKLGGVVMRDPAPLPSRALVIEGVLTEFEEPFLFKPGGVAAKVWFRDESGVVLAEGMIFGGNPSLENTVAWTACSTAAEIGGGIVNFAEDRFMVP